MHEVLVVNQGNNSITGFPLNRSTCAVDPTPSRIIGGGVGLNGTELSGTFALALDGAGRIYAANQGLGTPPSITEYDPSANGDASPDRRITNPQAQLVKPQGLAVRPSTPRLLLAANWVDPPDAATPSGILKYALTGSDAPIGAIRGANTTITTPGGVAWDSQLNIYVSDSATDRILQFAAPMNDSGELDIAPDRVIQGSNTGLDRPSGLAVDGDDNLYVTNLGNGSITVYAPGASGNQSPLRRIGGRFSTNTGLVQPFGIAVDNWCQLMFVTQAGNDFRVFSLTANGDPSPLQIIADPSLNYTTGIAVR